MQERTRHREPPSEDSRLTPDEFLAMVAERPDGERWELIEGIAIMNPSPTDWHQRIVLNTAGVLDAAKQARGTAWTAVLGIGTRVPVSPNSLPQPDLFVKEGPIVGAPVTDDAIVIVEVLSKSNSKADQSWRKRVYASVPNCRHYVTISTKSAEVVRYDLANDWKGERLTGLDACLELAAIDVSVPLRDIYRWTPIE